MLDRRVAFGVWMVLFSLCANSHAETDTDDNQEDKSVTIPLEHIWGHDRSLRGLEPELFIKRNTPEKRAEYSTPEKLQEIRDKAESSLAYQIERAMRDEVMNENENENQKFNEQQPAPGFAVVGRDRKALAGIHEVVVGGKEPQHKFSHKDEISLVFFTLVTNAGVRLIHTERIGTKINIHYALIITGTLGMSPRLYIIPVGKLPPDEYEVNLVRALNEEPKFSRKGFPVYEAGIEQSFVCQPFQFVVEDHSNGKGRER